MGQGQYWIRSHDAVLDGRGTHLLLLDLVAGGFTERLSSVVKHHFFDHGSGLGV